jgi:hypothetical protein
VSVLAIVLLVVLVVLLILFLGGTVANARHRRASAHELQERIAVADRDLAHAAAEDRGWDRPALENAVRVAWARREGVAAIDAISLVTVLDRPGTDEDEAVFLVHAGGAQTQCVLCRTGDVWAEAPAQPSASGPPAA